MPFSFTLSALCVVTVLVHSDPPERLMPIPQPETNEPSKVIQDLERQLYLANIIAAQALLKAGDRGVSERLSNCPPHLRGWEWRWLSAVSDSGVLRISMQESLISADFDPSGERIVTSGPVAVWDGTTGQLIRKLDGASNVTRDGRFAVGTDSQSATIWDMSTGREVAEFDGDALDIHTIVLSPDGSQVAMGLDGGDVQTWDVKTAKKLRVMKGPGDHVHGLCYSPDGSRILSYDTTSALWNAHTGELLAKLDVDPSDPWNDSVFSPDSTRLILNTGNSTSAVFDAQTGKLLFTLADDGDVSPGAFSPDSSRIVTTSKQHRAKVWDAATGKELASFHGHRGEVLDAIFSPDGTRIATIADDSTLRIWDLASQRELTAFSTPDRGLSRVRFNTDGTRIIANGTFGVTVWDVAAGNGIEASLDHTKPFFKRGWEKCIYSPDGLQLVIIRDGIAHLHDRATGRELATLRDKKRIDSVFFSPSGRRIVTATRDDRSGKVWDLASGKELLSFDTLYSAEPEVSSDDTWVLNNRKTSKPVLYNLANGEAVRAEFPGRGVQTRFNAAGTQLVTISDGKAFVWDTTGKRIAEIEGHRHRGYFLDLRSATFSPDGKRVVTLSHDDTVRIWDSQTGKQQLQIPAPNAFSAHFTPDNARLLVVTKEAATMCDASTGEPLWVIRGGPDTSVGFSPDGTRIVGRRGSVGMWDAATGTFLMSLTSEYGLASHAAFSPDGTRVITDGMDRGKVWDAVPYRIRRAERLANERGEDGAAIVREWWQAANAGRVAP